MAAYDWIVLKRQWERAELSVEQMVGQLLQWGEQTHQQNSAHERQLTALERQLSALTARVAALESQRLSK